MVEKVVLKRFWFLLTLWFNIWIGLITNQFWNETSRYRTWKNHILVNCCFDGISKIELPKHQWALWITHELPVLSLFWCLKHEEKTFWTMYKDNLNLYIPYETKAQPISINVPIWWCCVKLVTWFISVFKLFAKIYQKKNYERNCK